MANYTLQLNQAQLQAVGMEGARRIVGRIVRGTDTRSAVLCPADTGNLRASRRSSISSIGSMVRGENVYAADYAAAVHNGRRALTIRAKGGGMLKFKVDGRTVYARQVRQPARPGRPFLLTAFRETCAREGIAVTATRLR